MRSAHALNKGGLEKGGKRRRGQAAYMHACKGFIYLQKNYHITYEIALGH